MATKKKKVRAPDPVNEALIAKDDPGDAHSKGYTAEPGPRPTVPDDRPIPLAPMPGGPSQVRQPEREGKAQATGRKEPGRYTPNERLMGPDR
jgi:hypothetical protein